MTLDTKVFVLDEIDPMTVFRQCQKLIAAYDDQARPAGAQQWEHSQKKSRAEDGGEFAARPGNSWDLMNEPGQNLPAWLWLYHGDGGEPLVSAEDAAAHDEWCNIPANGDNFYPGDPECDGSGHSRMCWLKVSFDTAYGYRSASGLGCGELHAALVMALGSWLDAQGVRWQWMKESTGEVFDGAANLTDLCRDGAAAAEWLSSTVLPAIVASIVNGEVPS